MREEVERGGESVIRIHCVRKESVFNKRKSSLLVLRNLTDVPSIEVLLSSCFTLLTRGEGVVWLGVFFFVHLSMSFCSIYVYVCMHACVHVFMHVLQHECGGRGSFVESVLSLNPEFQGSNADCHA